jgi:hypothetical protein
MNDILKKLTELSINSFFNPGEPDPHVFGPPGSGSFPFLIKSVERTEIMLAK